MKFFAPMRIRVEKNSIVRIRRILKGKGTINVSKGREVAPSDIIGISQVSSGFRTIKLAQALEVSGDQAARYLKRPLGQRIYKGELLAQKVQLFGGKKIVISPTDAVLDFLNPHTGELRLTFFPKKHELPAGVYGIVDGIDSDRGIVIIRTQASIVYGMFGSGGVRDGILQTVGKRDELIGKPKVSPDYEGQILLGGSLVFRNAIASAISSGISGIITGGINAGDYKGMAGGRLTFPQKLHSDVGISVIVCEGFGPVPIGEDIYDALTSYNGRFVSINGNAGIIYLPSYDESCIVKVRMVELKPFPDNPQDFENNDVSKVSELRLGLKVRITGNSFAGNIGKISSLDATETVLPSGIQTFMATVETKRRKIQVPVANLEVIL